MQAELYLQAKDGGSAEGGNRLGSLSGSGGWLKTPHTQAAGWPSRKREGECG